MTPATTTMHILNRGAGPLRGGGPDEARVPVSLSRVTIAERRLDEIDADDGRPRWQGRPKRDDVAAILASSTWRPRVARAPRQRWKEPARPVTPVAPPPRETSHAPAPLPVRPPRQEAATIGALRVKSAMHNMRVRVVLRACAEAGGITVDDLRGEKRSPKFVRPRHVAAWLLINVVGLSLGEAGRALGGRDHSTALHGRRSVDAVLSRACLAPTDDMPAADFALVVLAAWGP
jgi:hypothetical protein